MNTSEAMQLLEHTITEWPRTALTQHWKDGILSAEVVDILFQVANVVGSVSCRPINEKHLSFTLGDTEIRVYEFPVGRLFRGLLGKLARMLWQQSPEKPKYEVFDIYGDKKVITYTDMQGFTNSYYVETANNLDKPLYLIIRRETVGADGID